MAPKALIILGSARKGGDTQKLVNRLFNKENATVLDLLDYHIFPYNYGGVYPKEDSFLLLINQMLKHQKIIFATPVYWYAMSGLIKTFFDRMTDVVTIQKQFGRKMNGKEVYLVSVGTDDALSQGFEVPFRLTAAYFDMNFIASYYCRTDKIAIERKEKHDFLRNFI